MRLEKVQEALNTKNIKYEYTEENGCGSLDFMFRGLRFLRKLKLLLVKAITN